MKSQGKDVVVSARKPARRGWGCVSFFRRGTAGVVAAGGMILGGNALLPNEGVAQGAYIFQQNDAAARSFGSSWADVTYRGAPVPSNFLPVPVPSVRAEVPGVGVGFATRSVAYLNQSTLVGKYHTYQSFLSSITGFVVDLDPDGNYSGAGTYKIEMVAADPVLDLVIFKPYVDGPNGQKIYTRMSEGPNLELGGLPDGENGIVTGVGDTRYVDTNVSFYDRLPRAFPMRSVGVDFGELSLIPLSASSAVFTASAENRYSGGGIYNGLYQLAGVTDNGLFTPGSLDGASIGASYTTLPAERALITQHSSIVPEPGSVAMAAAAAGFGLLARRRRTA